MVAITATPNSGYQFSSFTGALNGTTNPQNLTITGDATVTANFTAAGPRSVSPDSPNLTAYASGMGPPATAGSCGAPDCTWNVSFMTYVSPYQMYGDSQTYSTGNESWNTANSASNRIVPWNGSDLGYACQNPTTSVGGYVADARVPCPTFAVNGQNINFTVLSGPIVYTLYGSHSGSNSLVTPSVITAQTLRHPRFHFNPCHGKRTVHVQQHTSGRV